MGCAIDKSELKKTKTIYSNYERENLQNVSDEQHKMRFTIEKNPIVQRRVKSHSQSQKNIQNQQTYSPQYQKFQQRQPGLTKQISQCQQTEKS